MRIYKDGTTSITLAGQTFTADADGIIEVPGHLVENAFTQGFVSAKGRLRQLQNEAIEQALPPIPNSALNDGRDAGVRATQGAVAEAPALAGQQAAAGDTAAKKKQS